MGRSPVHEADDSLIVVDRWRQSFHLCPPQGLINDPNGLIYWRGAYHVFYQWNPDGCTHLNKHWAHVRSTDLVNWESLPVALAPDAAYDSHGCYSGSAVDLGDTMALIYTGNVRDNEGGRWSFQCLALSADGMHFRKYGPVMCGVPGYTQHFRDPKVWQHGDNWYATIGAQRGSDLAGTVVLAKSSDLFSWDVVGELLAPVDACYMVECPDLFSLDGKAVMICCRQFTRADDDPTRRPDVAGYMIGDLDLNDASFVHGDFRPLDRGFDFYAPQTLLAPDGRRLMIGWMGLPLQPQTPTVDSGWTHCLTMPRELSLEQGQLRQRPLRELAMLRETAIVLPDAALDVHDGLALPAPPGDAWELDVSLEASSVATWVLHLFEGAGQTLRLIRDGERQTLTLVRHCPAAGQLGEQSECELVDGVWRLQVFVDRSSVEIFVNDGEEVFSTRCYPVLLPQEARFAAMHPLRLHGIRLWGLGSSVP